MFLDYKKINIVVVWYGTFAKNVKAHDCVKSKHSFLIAHNLHFIISDALHFAHVNNMAIQVVKGIDHFPENKVKLEGNIDIWWIMNILCYITTNE